MPVVILAAVLLVAGLAHAFLRAGSSPAEPSVAAAGPDTASGIVHVAELAENPGAYRGEFVLHGVVAGVSTTDGVFGIIDSREFDSCGLLTCADHVIPVRFAGELPDLGTEVEITGRVIRRPEGLLIDARHVERSE